jgi:hypothetical protein
MPQKSLLKITDRSLSKQKTPGRILAYFLFPLVLLLLMLYTVFMLYPIKVSIPFMDNIKGANKPSAPAIAPAKIDSAPGAMIAKIPDKAQESNSKLAPQQAQQPQDKAAVSERKEKDNHNHKLARDAMLEYRNILLLLWNVSDKIQKEQDFAHALEKLAKITRYPLEVEKAFLMLQNYNASSHMLAARAQEIRIFGLQISDKILKIQHLPTTHAKRSKDRAAAMADLAIIAQYLYSQHFIDMMLNDILKENHF